MVGVQTLGRQDLSDPQHHSKWGQAQEGLDECVNKPAIQYLTPLPSRTVRMCEGPDANRHCSGNQKRDDS